jgi:hypothetical protein
MSLTRQQALLLGIYPIQVPTMGKDKHKGPDFLVPTPYVPEEEKEADPSDGKPPLAKLLLDSQGKKMIIQLYKCSLYSRGGTLNIFKWFQILSSLPDGKIVGEHFRLALQALRGTDKALWQRKMDLASPKLAEAAGLSVENAEKLWYGSIIKLTIHVLKDTRSGFKQLR